MSADPLSYYAMKSAQRLDATPWRPQATTDTATITGELRDAIARSELLDVLGMGTEEAFEYDAVVTGAGRSPDSLLRAAEALRRRGETSRAITLAQRALTASAPRDTRLFRLLYPVAFDDVIRAESRRRGVDPALVAALIHQESRFTPRAVSRAGALGLMQVLPNVGTALARQARVSPFERVLLFQPDVNIRLGTMHLDAMLDQYPHIEYALAAYNAGGSPVRRWRRKAGASDPELFIERIPYDETRDYVRILLRNRATYAMLYGW
jgi:soluble lytic murein transglycosylase